MSTEHMMVPTSNWLGSVTLDSMTIQGDLPTWAPSWYQSSWWPYCCPITVTSARPIRLTIAEVMRLRFLAQENPELKAILQKFTGQIEILVTFD